MEQTKNNPFIKILRKILLVIVSILILIIIWFTFCALNRKKSVAAIPSGYSVYVRTDSVWDAVNPLLDLKATDIVISTPALSPVRERIYNFRNSSLRKNFFIHKLLARKVDFALYDKGSFIAVADMGVLSGISRLIPLFSNKIKVENLSYVETNGLSYFVYEKEETKYYAKIYKNLIIFSQDFELFKSSTALDNENTHSLKNLELMKKPCKQPLKIIVDSRNAISLIASKEAEKNSYLKLLSDMLSVEDLSTVDLSITDSEILVHADFPFALDGDFENHPLAKIIQKDSTVPELLPELPESIQYYTFINAGSLDELKQAADSIVPDPVKFEKIWKTADTASSMLFNLSIEELLFSWTDDEFAVFGLEGKAEPVFAIKVKDEAQRQYVFDNILSSIILKSNTSLLVDGIRLPCIEIPGFFQAILELFGVSMPKPYYLVSNGYIYFSLSPENLVLISSTSKNHAKLSSSKNWNMVSTKQSPVSTVSLFYNLERSIPFFLKSNSTFSNVLKLYNIGRVDLCTQNNTVTLQFQAASFNSSSSNEIPGFPIEHEKSLSPVMCISNSEKHKTIFYLENKETVNSLNPVSLEANTAELGNIEWLVPASEKTIKSSNGELWAVNKNGTIYLLDKKLKTISGFPVMTGKTINCAPVLYQDSLLFISDEGEFCTIDANAKLTAYNTNLEDSIKASPAVSGSKIAVYEKGFLGGLYVYPSITEISEQEPYMMDGICYGSPCIFTDDGKTLVAIITQSGDLHVIDTDSYPAGIFPIKIDDIFYSNVQFADGYLFAFSSTGKLYRIAMDGSVETISLPDLSSKSSYMTVTDCDKDGTTDIFVCGNGNRIYGFTSKLEMLYSFPVAGYGIPVFADVNGDKEPDCIAVTTDNKVNAYIIN